MTEVAITADGFAVMHGDAEFAVYPVRRCIRCEADRPVVPPANDAYRCLSCGVTWDPSEASRASDKTANGENA